ncbi:putative E3 ubiquitin-protein ligase [Paratrimastix pyriformis]|uniref:E3 ubiquitin-protein ligase n=1 Tax=Paratrimastix pyriformis TaxID=342808 RepID=A0ABQ8UVT3_9EUKA|nr:putative E3 ubiquitin-protein ligase [Paratrimastix pyriformis]
MDEDPARFNCPVCQDILEHPVTTRACNHTFCRDCWNGSLSASEKCPLCRHVCTLGDALPNANMDAELHRVQRKCRYSGCEVTMALNLLRDHEASCPHADDEPIPTVEPHGPAQPNRSTFNCPYECGAEHLDIKQLVDHVLADHKRVKKPVVCPVCAAMPWGRADQVSGDFPAHLQARHRFQYDTYTDFDKDDDEILREVMARSLEDS